MGGGVVTVYVSLSKGDAPLSPELTVGANEDAVDWTIFPPLEYSQGRDKRLDRLWWRVTYSVAGE